MQVKQCPRMSGSFCAGIRGLFVLWGYGNDLVTLWRRSYNRYIMNKAQGKEVIMFGKKSEKVSGEVKALKAQLADSETCRSELELMDPITGMKNFLAVDSFLQEMEKGTADRLAVFVADVDGLCEFNGRWGYQKGNKLICCIGNAIVDCMPEEALVVSGSGGQFWIWITGLDAASAAEIGDTILSKIRALDLNRFLHVEGECRVSISVGSSLWDRSFAFDFDILQMNAAAALKEAKMNGGDQHIEYQEDQDFFSRLETDAALWQEMEEQMYPAMEKGEFVPFFQPRYNSMTGRICGAELLARWNHPDRGLLIPEDFLSIFERNRFIIDLDMFMFEQACRTIRRWLDENRRAVPLACNFSGQHFINPFWVEQMVEKTKQPADPVRNSLHGKDDASFGLRRRSGDGGTGADSAEERVPCCSGQLLWQAGAFRAAGRVVGEKSVRTSGKESSGIWPGTGPGFCGDSSSGILCRPEYGHSVGVSL